MAVALVLVQLSTGIRAALHSDANRGSVGRAMRECNPVEEYAAGDSSAPMSAGDGRNAAPEVSVHIGWIDFACLKFI